MSARTPVREAFRQLELEGLIQIIPNKGAYVTGITEKDVKDIYMIRSRLEGLCARWATEHITKEQLDELEECVYLAKFHAAKGHMEQLPELDNRFHEILYEACDSKMLEHQLRDFHAYVLRVRRKTLSTPERSMASNEEHEKIMLAIKDRNADEAERLAHMHMINAYENMVKNGLHEAYENNAAAKQEKDKRGHSKMSKIQMTTPLVEMDGDEMTRILWKMIKDELLLPFIDLKTEYYDLGLEYRNETNDQVTVDSANATLKYGVAVKCATITPNAARMTEYNLKEMWKSPNGTIRAILDGTVFRTPIVVKGIEPCVKNWKKPITLARHAYGDVYKNTEMKIPGPGKAELVFTAEDGTETRELIHDFNGAGVLQGMHNTDKSITSFARACFSYALDLKAGFMVCHKGYHFQKI